MSVNLYIIPRGVGAGRYVAQLLFLISILWPIGREVLTIVF
jgi:hypothetical protein